MLEVVSRPVADAAGRFDCSRSRRYDPAEAGARPVGVGLGEEQRREGIDRAEGQSGKRGMVVGDSVPAVEQVSWIKEVGIGVGKKDPGQVWME